MNRDTAAALARINSDFYHRHAAEFSATRERPWAAWEQVAGVVEERAGDGPIATLDLGCGNGISSARALHALGDEARLVGLDPAVDFQGLVPVLVFFEGFAGLEDSFAKAFV